MGLGQLTTRVIALQNALIEPKNKKEREKKKKKKISLLSLPTANITNPEA